MSFTLRVGPNLETQADPTEGDLDAISETLEKRLNRHGVTDLALAINDDKTITVVLPQMPRDQVDAIREHLQKVAKLELKEVNPQSSSLAKAAYEGDEVTKLTENMAEGVDRIAVLLDDEVITAPVVQSTPLGRNFVIMGQESYKAASALATQLTNPLRYPVRIVKEEPISRPLLKQYHTESEAQD